MSEFPFHKLKIKNSQKEIEPQEILLDSLAKKKEEEFGLSERKLELPLSQKIIQGFFLAFFIVVFIFLARTLQLQVLQGETLAQLSKENEFVIRSIKAERGVIYDSNFNQLVFNKPSFDFFCQGKIVSEKLDHQTLLFLKTRINEYPGCEIKNNTAREYILGSVFSQLIGYKRKTEEKTGLEQYYDDILKAKDGQLQIKRDAKGSIISKEITSLPEPGQSLVLWLNADLQKKLYQSLEQIIREVGSRSGAAIALDPKTGGVLALVSYPSFDNNLFSQEISQEEWQILNNNPNDPLFNRAISGIGYPTGSIIKPLIGIAALEEGIINPDSQIYSPLEICVQNPWYLEKQDCYADWKYHGNSDLKRAIAESVNTFFYQVGGGYQNLKGLGASKIKKWLEIFGWGSMTGIDLPKEGKGILPDLEQDWRLGDTYHLSIGQGRFAVTPIQVAAAFVAVANGGKLFQPQVVKEIIDSEKNLIKSLEPKFLKEILMSKENLETVRQGMRQSVTFSQSPAHILNSLPVAVASKTGTAQTGKEEIYHNWLTVFGPYEDSSIVLTIIIEDVKGTQAAALPVAREVLEWYFSTSQLDINYK